jgi:hypothetical protein
MIAPTQAGLAAIAMDEILPPSTATYTALLAMVDGLARVVAPELALGAVIGSHTFAAATTLLPHGLDRPAKSAQHEARTEPVQLVIAAIVVAVPTHDPLLTALGP